MRCKECGEDSGNYELCKECYYEQEDEGYNGMSKGKGNYRYGMIKGRIAESLIEELFLALGYNVFRYGMENTVPAIMKLLKGVRGDVANDIKRMPDFVVQKPKTKEAFFIEVKFRKNEIFTIEDLPKNFPYENAYFVIVSKKHIKCISFKELKNGKSISPEDRNYLGNREEFISEEKDREIIKDFCNFATKFFENV